VCAFVRSFVWTMVHVHCWELSSTTP
jgi:hypothetical protein